MQTGTPFLEYFVSYDMKAYFPHNQRIKPYLNLFYNRSMKSMWVIIKSDTNSNTRLHKQRNNKSSNTKTNSRRPTNMPRQTNKHNNKQRNKNA